MNKKDLKEIEHYFISYKKGTYYSSYSHPINDSNFLSHNDIDWFQIVIFPNDSVYQLNTDHESYGIELKSLEDFATRFKSFTGQEYYEIELSYDERINLFYQNKKEEAPPRTFISPGILTTEPGPSFEYLDSLGIPKYKKHG